MELKSYQKKVIKDFSDYLELLTKTHNNSQAYKILWNNKGVPIGDNGIKPYTPIISGVPHICFKVPTGGGKTFLACNAIKTFYSYVDKNKPKVVVWLVPSDPIKEQTFKNLTNPNHPYRQKINSDFNYSVEVLSKEQALMGQGFQPDTVIGQLTILVLSYDSFKRGRSEESLRSYRENSNLMNFSKVFAKGAVDIENADDTSLFQTISNLNPFVIVDESHNAKSELSIDMLKNFNPCCVLDLTATPQKNSNVISIVSPHQLKNENMVKLPVLLYNRKTKDDVISDAVSLRNRLEKTSIDLQINGQEYIRPIILFQAQSKTKDDNTTFENIKNQLVSDYSIPPEQIAIQTANIKELKGIDLLSKNCEVRYIITINALKEGWDCPFAYILATVANRTSEVDVEQILGRVLRQPYTKQSKNNLLNMSYVITSSSQFSKTAENIVSALRLSGFSDRDCRCENADDTVPEFNGLYEPVSETEQPLNLFDDMMKSNTIVGNTFSSSQEQQIPQQDDTIKRVAETNDGSERLSRMIESAEKQGTSYNEEMKNIEDDDIPNEVSDRMVKYGICEDFKSIVENLLLPQFYEKSEVFLSFFDDNEDSLLCKESLNKEFNLSTEDCNIDFGNSEKELVKVDVEEYRDNPTYTRLGYSDNEYFSKLFENQPTDKKIAICKSIIRDKIGSNKSIADSDLKKYVDRIVESMSNDDLSMLEYDVTSYANKINRKVEQLLKEHRYKNFMQWITINQIYCKPSYKFPKNAIVSEYPISIAKSLYTTEFTNNQNAFETKVIEMIVKLDNVMWWHRNIERKGFCINGFINHYPDFILYTRNKNIVVLETKGDDRDNSDSLEKATLGQKWANLAGTNYKYFMVFDKSKLNAEGCYTLDEFIKTLEKL